MIDPRAGKLDHEHSARRQTGIRRVGRRRQGLRESHRHERGGRDRREGARRSRGAGPTAPCKQPVAMAIDTAHHRLFSGCRSGVMAVSDYQAGKVVATRADRHGRRRRRLRSGVRRRVCVERRRHADRHSSGHARTSITSSRTLQTPPASRNMGLDPTTHRIFIVAAKFGPAPAGGRGRGPVLPGSFALLVVERSR